MARSSGNKDGNQDALVRGQRGVGLSVAIMSGVPAKNPALAGFPDLLVGGQIPCPHCGRSSPGNVLQEVKDPAQPPSRRQLTADELGFHAKWRGQIVVVETLAEALAAAGVEAR